MEPTQELISLYMSLLWLLGPQFLDITRIYFCVLFSPVREKRMSLVKQL